jgi:hypothetical protein
MENPTCLGRRGLVKYFSEGAEEASKFQGIASVWTENQTGSNERE